MTSRVSKRLSLQGLRRALLATTVPAVALSSGHAVAQEAQVTAPPLEEVVVSARMRSETLISVPVAVTALSAEDLARYGATSLSHMAEQAPTVFISKTGSGTGGIVSIRGIGTTPNNGGFESSVSVNIDGVQVSRGRIATQSFFDLQQVEILKGPQALFFGKNSPAGVISLVSNGPTDTWEGYGKVGYEFVGDESSVEGAVSGPLSDTLGLRVAARVREMDGYLRNRAQPVASNPFPADPSPLPGASFERPGEQEALGRVTLKWRPGDRVDAALKLYVSRYRDDGPAAAGGQLVSCGTSAAPETGGQFDPYGDCKPDDRTSNGTLPAQASAGFPLARREDGKPYGLYNGTLVSVPVNIQLTDALTLNSVTGYYDGNAQYFDNYGADVWAQKGSAESDHYRTFSQELRLSSDWDGFFNFMVGAYYQDTALDFRNVSKVFAVGADPVTGTYYNWDKVATTDGETLSAFGQVRLNLTEQLELSGGVRWTDEKKDSTVHFAYAHPVLLARNVLSLNTVEPKFSDTNFSPEATLAFHPSTESTVYVAYKTGYKSGGANLSALVTPATTDASMVFGPEEVKGVEFGAKGQLFERRLLLELSAYRYDYEDLQVNVYDTIASTFVVTNAARVNQKGVETKARWTVSDEFSLRGAVSYNKNRFTDYQAQCYAQQTAAQGCVGGVRQNLAGRATARSPDWSGNVGATLDVPMGNALSFGLAADAYYTGKYYSSETQAPGALQESFWRFDASARVVADAWELALLGRNLSNEFYIVYATDKPGTSTSQQYGTVSRGREVWLEATYRF
ncbi:TonB-dependent receptor [Peristeroidobacter soli]|uniref:TonB-dependent receptor n=1 Tax=Peristeroidobacter soli TaxID=2497877 RepID=UPI00158DE129|nr:TonB-dependent receptor [Peristeroidobacter soli]